MPLRLCFFDKPVPTFIHRHTSLFHSFPVYSLFPSSHFLSSFFLLCFSFFFSLYFFLFPFFVSSSVPYFPSLLFLFLFFSSFVSSFFPSLLDRYVCEQLVSCSIFKPHCSSGIPFPLLLEPIQFSRRKRLFISSPRKSNPWLFLLRSVYSKLNFICQPMVSERVLPHPTQWRYLLHHVTCVTYPGMGMLFCARSSSSLRGKLPQKFPHSRNVESRRLIAHVGILYSGLHSASDEGTVGSDAQWTQPCGSHAEQSLANRGYKLCTGLFDISNKVIAHYETSSV